MKRFKFIGIVATALFFLWLLFMVGKKIKQRWIVEKTIQSEHWQQRNQTISEAIPNKYKVVFLGNSLIEMWDINYYFNDSTLLNAGITGDFTEGLIKRLDNIIRLKPEKLFIEIGINDIIEKIPLDEICTNYTQIIKTVQEKSPQTKIFIHSNLPVIIRRFSILTGNDDVNNRVIQQNENLKKLAKELNVTYINVHATLIKQPNFESLYIADGIHLSPTAYTIWKNILMPYLY